MFTTSVDIYVKIILFKSDPLKRKQKKKKTKKKRTSEHRKYKYMALIRLPDISAMFIAWTDVSVQVSLVNRQMATEWAAGRKQASKALLPVFCRDLTSRLLCFVYSTNWYLCTFFFFFFFLLFLFQKAFLLQPEINNFTDNPEDRDFKNIPIIGILHLFDFMTYSMFRAWMNIYVQNLVKTTFRNQVWIGSQQWIRQLVRHWPQEKIHWNLTSAQVRIQILLGNWVGNWQLNWQLVRHGLQNTFIIFIWILFDFMNSMLYLQQDSLSVRSDPELIGFLWYLRYFTDVFHEIFIKHSSLYPKVLYEISVIAVLGYPIIFITIATKWLDNLDGVFYRCNSKDLWVINHFYERYFGVKLYFKCQLISVSKQQHFKRYYRFHVMVSFDPQETRAVIKFCCQLGYSPTKTFELIQQTSAENHGLEFLSGIGDSVSEDGQKKVRRRGRKSSVDAMFVATIKDVIYIDIDRRVTIRDVCDFNGYSFGTF